MDFNPVENSPLFKTVGVIDGPATKAISLLQTNQANSEREDLSSLKVWEVNRQEIEKAEKVEMLKRKLQMQ
jgi:hypothetical protein